MTVAAASAAPECEVVSTSDGLGGLQRSLQASTGSEVGGQLIALCFSMLTIGEEKGSASSAEDGPSGRVELG